jgi:uncharacterized SAM-binding protein YcdF (DUF218 family)
VSSESSTTPVLRHAETLWTFLTAGARHQPSELLVVCGSYDLRVCDHACDLVKRGVAPRMLITGGSGNWTRHLWGCPESTVFAERARSHGLIDDQILLESRASNFAENIALSRAMCPAMTRITFVTKPNSIRRVYQTLPVQWPDIEPFVDAPSFEFPWGVSNCIGVFGLIEEMVGDVHRILVYPELGFQAPLTVPALVIAAWDALISQGFDRHLVPGRHPSPVFTR